MTPRQFIYVIGQDLLFLHRRRKAHIRILGRSKAISDRLENAAGCIGAHIALVTSDQIVFAHFTITSILHLSFAPLNQNQRNIHCHKKPQEAHKTIPWFRCVPWEKLSHSVQNSELGLNVE